MSFWLITFLASKTKFRKRENLAMVCFYQRRNAPSLMWQQWMWRICEIKVQYGSGCQGFPNSITFMELSHNKFKLSSTRETPSILFHRQCGVWHDEETQRENKHSDLLNQTICCSLTLPFPCCIAAQIIHKVVVLENQHKCCTADKFKLSPEINSLQKSPDCTCGQP